MAIIASTPDLTDAQDLARVVGDVPATLAAFIIGAHRR